MDIEQIKADFWEEFDRVVMGALLELREKVDPAAGEE